MTHPKITVGDGRGLSREFMIGQAALQVMPAGNWRNWYDFVSSFGDKEVTYISVRLREAVRAEFRKLVSQYAEAAE